MLTDRFGPIRVIMVAVIADRSRFSGARRYRIPSTVAALLLALFAAPAGAEQHVALSNRAVEHRQRALGFNFMLVNLGIDRRSLSGASSTSITRSPSSSLHLQRGHHSDGG